MPGVLSLNVFDGLRRRGPGRIRPSLKRLSQVLGTLGNPQHSFRSVLIVGTNGKGSTAASLERILSASRLKTGLYTSPHLISVSERISAGGKAVPEPDLARILHILDEFPDLTFFETLTAAAFLHFAAASVDVAVLEAGMGGRWDATRLAASEVAGLTNVGTDHSAWLGACPAEVAADKGAALAAASFAVLGPGVRSDILADLGAPGATPAAQIVDLKIGGGNRVTLRLGDGEPSDLRSPLVGRHQLDNLHLALALAVVELRHGWGRELTVENVCRGLAEVRWPGRLSETIVGGRRVVLDAAHNIEAAEALANHLATLPRAFNLLFSCLEDKKVEEMAGVLRPVVGDVVVFPLEDERAMPVDRMAAALAPCRTATGAAEGLALLADPILAAGSLRVVGRLLRGENGGGERFGRR